MLEDKNKKVTPLDQLGEFPLIERLTKDFPVSSNKLIRGVGDDAAVIDNGDEYLLITTDILTENIHFDFMYTPPKHLGYKMAVVNFSDIYAMNGKPEVMTIGMALSNRMSVEVLEEIYEGVAMACEKYGVMLAGGDTTSSSGGQFFCITVTGRVNKNKITYRSGANTNDLVCVTGDLGAAYAGLQLLEREKRIFLENPQVQPDLSEYDYVLQRQLKPEARKDIVEWFENQNVVPTSMIDISDGLSSETMHLSKASGKGLVIYENKIPIDWQTAKVAEELNMHAVNLALNGGEDYELLFTIKPGDFNKITQNKNIHIIGYVGDEGQKPALITNADQWVEMKALGWKSF